MLAFVFSSVFRISCIMSAPIQSGMDRPALARFIESVAVVLDQTGPHSLDGNAAFTDLWDI
jgi:hypothetical protein